MHLTQYSKLQLYALFTLRADWLVLFIRRIGKIIYPKLVCIRLFNRLKRNFCFWFVQIANNPTLLDVVNFVNEWGLTFVGLSLILGLFTRLGYLGAILFLLLFYLSHPPLLNVEYIMPTEGSYLWIDKNLIMLFAVLVLTLFHNSRIISFDRLLFRTDKKQSIIHS